MEVFLFLADMLASPQLPVAAMENWGLVTFREASILFEAGKYIPQAQQRVAHEVAHEFAHQVSAKMDLHNPS